MKSISRYVSAAMATFLLAAVHTYAQQGMGVGVTSPQEKLDVNGAIKIGATSNTNAGTIRWTGTEFQGYNGSQWLNFGGSDGWLLTGNSGTTPGSNFIGTTDNTDIRFRTNNLERMTITNTGNVGVGTTITSSKLHVDGSITMVDGNQAAGYVPVSDANGTMTWTDPANIDDGDWIVSGNNLFNNNTGRIGMYNTDPRWKVTMGATQNVFISNDEIDPDRYGVGFTRESGSDGQGIGIGFGSSNSGLHCGAGIVFKKTGNSSVGDLMLAVKKTYMSFDVHFPALTVQGISGNIGIGTLTPSEKLEVQGPIRMVDGNQAAGYIPVSDANGTMTWTDPSSINDGDWTVGGNDISNANSGNVGIGTNSPESLLNIRVENDGLNYPLILRNTHSNQAGGNAVGIGFTNNSNMATAPKAMLVHERTGGFGQGSFHFLMNTASGGSAATLNDAKVTITSNGNVGIGTTTPSEKLEVQGSIRMVDGNQQAGYVPVSDVNGTMTWTDPTTISTSNDGDWTISGNNIGNSNSGNVGIGTTNPESLFNVRVDNNGLNYPLVLRNWNATQTGGNAVGIGFNNNDTPSAAPKSMLVHERTGSFGKGSFHFLMSQTSNNTAATISDAKVTITSNGNLGVGTTTPSDKLEVQGSIRMVDGNQQAGYIPVSDANGKMTWTDPLNVSDGDWTTNGNDIYPAVSGNVGIGTSTPESLLTVRASGNTESTPVVLRKDGISNTGNTIGLGFTIETGQNLPKSILAFERTNSDARGAFHFLLNTNADASGATLADAVMTVKHTGNVGVGTTTPSDKLDVQGSIRMVDGNQQAGYIPVSDANGKMTWTDPGTIAGDTLNIIADADNDTKIQVEKNSDEDKIRFDLAGTEMFRMERFGAYGEAGINVKGTSLYMGQNISSTVSGFYNIVIGNNAGTALDSSAQNVLIGSGSGRYQTSGEQNTALGFRSAVQNLTGNYGVFVGAYSAGNMTSGNFNLIMGYGTAANKSSGSQNVLLGANAGYNSDSSSYNVFVGTNSGRNATGSFNVFIGQEAGYNEIGDNKLYIENTTSSTPLIYGEFDNDIVAINGNLGVATSAPAASLNILEADESTTQTDFTQNVADAGLLVTTGYTNGAYTPGLFWNTTDNNPTLPKAGIFMQETNSGSKILFGTSNTYTSGITNTNVVINENGNVGIGTSNPGSLLDINAASGNAIINLVPGASSIPRIWFRNPSNSIVWNIGSNTSEHFAFFNGQTSSTPFIIEKGGASNTLVVDENSRVGIGTNAPAEELEVQGSIRMVDGNQAAGYIPVSDANGTMTWTDPSTIDDGDWTVSGNNVHLSGSGNVGIGTTSPSYILSLGGDANRTVGIERSTGADGFDLTLRAGGANTGVADKSGGNLILSGGISTGNGSSISDPDSKIIFMTSTPLGSSSSTDVVPTEKMRVTAQGNLGVGSTLPASKLVVQDDANGFEGFVARVINTANSNSSRDEGLLIRAGHNTYNSGQESSLIQFEKPNGSYMGRIRQSGSTAVEYVSASDERLKTDIVPTEYGLTNLLNIDVKDYYFKADKTREGRQTGFIAQQLYQHYPVAVDVGSEDLSQPWGVAYGMMTPLLVKAIQEQQEIIDAVRTENEALKAELEEQKIITHSSILRLEAIEEQLGINTTTKNE